MGMLINSSYNITLSLKKQKYIFTKNIQVLNPSKIHYPIN